MKIFASVAALLLAWGASMPATAIEVLNNPHAGSVRLAPHPDLAPSAHAVILPTAQSSELPEPDVVMMMLLGLVLIGWRASRDSTDTFK